MNAAGEKTQRTASFLLMGLFLALLWTPTLDTFFHLDKAPTPNEKRLPAKFPAAPQQVKEIQPYVAGLESYYNDHFGFRKRLIRWEHRWRRGLFKESTLSDVMIGRDGWLYFAGSRMIENYRGMRPFTPEQLHGWQLLLERRRDWLAQRGIKYLFVIPPNKESVYPEYLPEWMTKLGPETRLDQFFAHMQKHSTVPVLDLRPALLAGKTNGFIYLQTDTHWNLLGGFLGYQEVMRALAQQLPGLAPRPLSSFTVTPVPHGAPGDMAVMLNQERNWPEHNAVELRPHGLPADPKIVFDANVFPDKKWTPETTPSLTENPRGQYRALFFRDSFSGGLIPFLRHDLQRAVYIWDSSWNPALIEKEKPDIVVDEVLERFFNEWDPIDMAKKEKVR